MVLVCLCPGIGCERGQMCILMGVVIHAEGSIISLQLVIGPFWRVRPPSQVGRHRFSRSGFLGVSSAFGLTAPAQLLKGGDGETQGARIAPRMLANSKWTTWNFSMAIYIRCSIINKVSVVANKQRKTFLVNTKKLPGWDLPIDVDRGSRFNGDL